MLIDTVVKLEDKVIEADVYTYHLPAIMYIQVHHRTRLFSNINYLLLTKYFSGENYTKAVHNIDSMLLTQFMSVENDTKITSDCGLSATKYIFCENNAKTIGTANVSLGRHRLWEEVDEDTWGKYDDMTIDEFEYVTVESPDF